jgi:hypothetical protein
MSVLAIDYRPPQPRRPIINRTSTRLLLVVFATIGLFAVAVYLLSERGPAPGTPQSTVISFVDARTNKPIPITISSRGYPASDPWGRKITLTAPNTVRLQWLAPKTAEAYITSPGYQGVGVTGFPNYRPALTIGLWPAPAPATPATTQPSAVPTGNGVGER